MGPATRSKRANEPNKEQPDSLGMLMRDEKRRAGARTHGDIWQEHRKPSSKADTTSKKRKKSAEKKAAEETGEDDAFKVLQAEQKTKTTKRKSGEPFEEKKEPAKKAPKRKSEEPSKEKEEPRKRARKDTETKDEPQERDTKSAEEPGAKAAPDSGDASGQQGGGGAVSGVVTINRAPTLTLWVATVAERQGYKAEEALTFGKYVSGVFAQSKGKSIGVIEADPEKEAQVKEAKREQRRGLDKVPVFGMNITVKKTPEGQVRALEAGGKPIEPRTVKAYLHRAFKDRLDDAQKAMEALAAAYPAEEVGKKAYHLYERFRPTVPQGKKGWGGKGELDLDLISNKMVQESSARG
ncbi:hypothetical protein KFL_003920130 [Klebsormidium nitens]|uniref:Uncharacterized protein n=1 Tax=Klebsormidium nitens TaxID=105231 RepID=A0A1Y1IBP5_KLENI|nr:hypothetical protein KFL_003920130 [Klebsormidium nitens]|eukprot:GAQ87993.1 hypothetical protein KFL_003920130 [Klebsormidium nitens]